MNIAWLTPEVPYPPIGGRNGVYNRIVQLSRNNTIYLFSIAYDPDEKANTAEMRKYCKEVYYFDRSEHKAWTMIKSLVMPYSIASRYRKDIINGITKLVEKDQIDIIIVDFPNMARNVIPINKKFPHLPMTINQHNVEFKRMRDMYTIQTIPFYKRIAYYLESFRLEAFERKLYRSGYFKGISFFSEDDCEFFKSNIDTGNAVLKTIPLGANDYSKTSLGLNNKTLLFVGRLDKIAITNVEAVLWFVKNVFSKIKKRIPDVQFIIAGANPSEEILGLACKSIKVIPNFSSLDEVYGMADIVIIPLLSGGGVKGKLLEAIAFRKHIITTSHGTEGTLFEKDLHVSVADSAEEFAEECIKVLSEPVTYTERENRAYKLFREEYEWESIGNKYSEFVESISHSCLQPSLSKV